MKYVCNKICNNFYNKVCKNVEYDVGMWSMFTIRYVIMWSVYIIICNNVIQFV